MACPSVRYYEKDLSKKLVIIEGNLRNKLLRNFVLASKMPVSQIAPQAVAQLAFPNFSSQKPSVHRRKFAPQLVAQFRNGCFFPICSA
jgi:hypothetical protein